MSISGNYGQMAYQIADELGDRQDLLFPLADEAGTPLALGPIPSAIQSAIALWERERFYFNEILVDFNAQGIPTSPWYTVQGQEYYDSSDYAGIPTIAKFDKLWVLINANRYTLTPRTFEYMADTSVNPAVIAYPVDYAYSGLKVKMYPIPDGHYPMGFLGTQRFPTLTQGADSNAWTQDAYDLIRCQAKLYVASETLHNAAIRDECVKAIYGDPSVLGSRGYLSALKGETTRRRGGGGMKPTYF